MTVSEIVKKFIILDIDGTIADESERIIAADTKQGIDWEKLFDKDLMMNDIPNIELRNRIKHEFGDCGIIYLTARSSDLRDVTLKWLVKNEFDLGYLCMRDGSPYDKNLDTEKYKIDQIFKLLRKFGNIVYAFGDTDEDISAYNYYNISNERINFRRVKRIW